MPIYFPIVSKSIFEGKCEVSVSTPAASNSVNIANSYHAVRDILRSLGCDLFFKLDITIPVLPEKPPFTGPSGTAACALACFFNTDGLTANIWISAVWDPEHGMDKPFKDAASISEKIQGFSTALNSYFLICEGGAPSGTPTFSLPCQPGIYVLPETLRKLGEILGLSPRFEEARSGELARAFNTDIEKLRADSEKLRSDFEENKKKQSARNIGVLIFCALIFIGISAFFWQLEQRNQQAELSQLVKVSRNKIESLVHDAYPRCDALRALLKDPEVLQADHFAVQQKLNAQIHARQIPTTLTVSFLEPEAEYKGIEKVVCDGISNGLMVKQSWLPECPQGICLKYICSFSGNPNVSRDCQP